MITDIESLFAISAKWPPTDHDTKERLELCERNENLFLGDHNKVWQDELRKLRGDKSGDIRFKLNYFELLSLLWADLSVGEAPDAKIDGDNQAEADALTRIIQANHLWSVIGDSVIDLSKYGDAVLKIRYDKRGIIENVPPEYWFPVVEAGNIKQIKAHILAYTFEKPGENQSVAELPVFFPASSQLSDEQQKALITNGPLSAGKISYLKAEIHTIGKIEHRLYRLKDHQIDSQLDLSTFDEFKVLERFQGTGLDDFAIIVIHNITSTKKYHGKDDYSNIIDIVKELELRYSQISFVEDKFTDPWVYGPQMEEQDPRDGEFKIMGGSKYISLVEGQSPPGALTWDCQLPANFQTIGGDGWGLMQRFYELSETCKVAFDASAGGQGLSAQALKLMLFKPLKKSNRIQTRFNPETQKAIRLCSQIEVFMGMAGAVEIPAIKIVWHDGLPQDHNADAQRDATLVNGKVRSAQGLMREKGMSEEDIQKETDEIMQRQGL